MKSKTDKSLTLFKNASLEEKVEIYKETGKILSEAINVKISELGDERSKLEEIKEQINNQ